jgi:hypothetical protein
VCLFTGPWPICRGICAGFAIPIRQHKAVSVTNQTGFQENRFRGQIVRIGGTDYFIKTKEGTEVQVYRGETTKVTEAIKQGNMIEAKVDDNIHMLSIQPFSKTIWKRLTLGSGSRNDTNPVIGRHLEPHRTIGPSPCTRHEHWRTLESRSCVD